LIAYRCGLVGDALSQTSAGRAGVPVKTQRSRERCAPRKMKNSGNEAKEYLKTKDITFLNDANYARFARNLTPN
jgi:hypothetical protein